MNNPIEEYNEQDHINKLYELKEALKEDKDISEIMEELTEFEELQ